MRSGGPCAAVHTLGSVRAVPESVYRPPDRLPWPPPEPLLRIRAVLREDNALPALGQSVASVSKMASAESDTVDGAKQLCDDCLGRIARGQIEAVAAALGDEWPQTGTGGEHW